MKYFRYRKALGLPYIDQGRIFFKLASFYKLPRSEKMMIEDVLRQRGEYYKALKACLTSPCSVLYAACKFCCDESTLWRLVNEVCIELYNSGF